MSRKLKVPRILVNKKLWAFVAVVAVLVVVFYIGNSHGKSSQTTPSDSSQTSSFQNSKAFHGQPTQQSLHDQSTKAVQQSKLQPSSGHLNLSGTVTEVSDKSISIKLANDQTVSFSVPSDILVMVVNTGAKSATPHASTTATKHTIKDVKKGDKATIMVNVNADGTFVVRTIRTYGK